MAETKTYRVLRHLDGDRPYAPGDTRELPEAEAKHLVDLGVLELVGSAKAEPPVKNKAAAPLDNKAVVASTTKARSRKR